MLFPGPPQHTQYTESEFAAREADRQEAALAARAARAEETALTTTAVLNGAASIGVPTGWVAADDGPPITGATTTADFLYSRPDYGEVSVSIGVVPQEGTIDDYLQQAWAESEETWLSVDMSDYRLITTDLMGYQGAGLGVSGIAGGAETHWSYTALDIGDQRWVFVRVEKTTKLDAAVNVDFGLMVHSLDVADS